MRIGYVCRGGAGIGWGHLNRGRALLEAHGFQGGFLVGAGRDEARAWVLDLDLPVHVDSWDSLEAPSRASVREYDTLVVDDYVVTDAWLSETNAERPVFLIDDWMRRTAPVHCVVNPNIGASSHDYSLEGETSFLGGAQYTLLRAEVAELARTAKPVQARLDSVFVTLGGSDPAGVTALVADMLTKTSWYRRGGRLELVLGPSYRGPEPWLGWGAERTAGLGVVRAPRDFLRRAAQADVVVCGASVASYEMGFLGRAIIPVAFVDNQLRVALEWGRAGVTPFGPQLDAGWLQALASYFERLEAPAERKRLARIALSQVDGMGKYRLLNALGQAVGTGSRL